MPTVLITGANKGLGLEFARQYAASGWKVIATSPRLDWTDALRELNGALQIEKLDVRSADELDALARALEGVAIDVLLLNAGVHLQKDKPLDQLDPDTWLEELRVNVIAPVMVARRFAPLVGRSAQRKIVAMSSSLGSIAMNTAGGNLSYRSAKSALNSALRTLAVELRSSGVIVAPIAPGITRTDMGGPLAPFTAQDSVERVRQVIAELTIEHSGRFFSRDGTELAW